MSKQKHGKENHRHGPPQKVQQPAPNKIKSSSSRKSWSVVSKIGGFIFVLSVLLYVQTAHFGFTLDDRLVVFENTLTKQGIKAVPEIFSRSYLYGSVVSDNKIYRPVSKAFFAICWSLHPDSPLLFHWMNILFFALTGVLLFWVLVRFFPDNLFVAFIITLLYVTHPIHTEVVCSIKSLDEILCLLFFLVSVFWIQAYLKNGKVLYLLAAATSFFFSFISKESGITFLAVYPIATFFSKTGKKEIYKITVMMLVVVVLVFGIRALVLNSNAASPVMASDNIMAGTQSFIVQRATAIYLLGKYVLLLLFPHPLVCDYSPQQIALVGPGNIYFLLSFLLLTGALGYALWKLPKRNWIAFGILFFFITISVTSNIFFLSGSHFAERFLYTPSLGFCLILGVLLDKYVDVKKKNSTSFFKNFSNRPVLTAIAGIIAVLYSVKTITQSPVWKNNITLFENGIKYSPKSYRMHLSLAQDLSDKKYIEQFPPAVQQTIYSRAINEAKTSLLYFRDVDAYDMIGNIFYSTKQFDSSLHYYFEGLKMVPDYEGLNYHVGKAYDQLKAYNEALPYLYKALSKNPKNDGVLYNLALSYTNNNNLDSGLYYFKRVIKLRPNGPDAYYYAGLIFRAKGDSLQAKEYLNKADALGGPRE